jgi:hypothetical protein
VQVNLTSSTAVTITNDDSENASFTAPSVSSDTNLVFIFKGIDANRSVGFDKVTVTVRNTTTQPPSSSHHSSKSSSGCFITSVLN